MVHWPELGPYGESLGVRRSRGLPDASYGAWWGHGATMMHQQRKAHKGLIRNWVLSGKGRRRNVRRDDLSFIDSDNLMTI